MSTNLDLIVPENERTEDLLRQYYAYRREKREEIRPEYDWPKAEETSGYKVGQEMLDDHFYLTESLPRELLDQISTDELYGSMGRVLERKTLYGDEIGELIEILREAQQGLIEEGLDETKAKIRVEGAPISLCEFALEHGYGLELSE